MRADTSTKSVLLRRPRYDGSVLEHMVVQRYSQQYLDASLAHTPLWNIEILLYGHHYPIPCRKWSIMMFTVVKRISKQEEEVTWQ